MLLTTPYFLSAFLIIRAREFHWTPDQPVNLWEMSGQFEGDITIKDGISPRNALKSGLWPNGIIPYTINEDQDKYKFSEEEVNIILSVMKELEDIVSSLGHKDDQCQLKFVPRNESQKGFLIIIKGRPELCISDIGYEPQARITRLGNWCITPDMGTVRHELMHVLGFEHQHSAHNRDEYVVIHWENIKKNESSNFLKASSERYTDFGLGYDFDSIMHYSPYAFAEFRGGRFVGPTITPKDPTKVINRTSQLSDQDKLKQQLMYCKKYTHVDGGQNYEKVVD